jgi:PhnB protein
MGILFANPSGPLIRVIGDDPRRIHPAGVKFARGGSHASGPEIERMANGEHMQIETYLSFNGNCAEAFKFYEQCLGGKIAGMMKYSESPMADQTPSEWRDKVMHARLDVGGEALMGADAPPKMFSGNHGFSVSIGVTDPGEAKRIFSALSEGADVKMPLGQTFWSPAFGMLVDRFGIPWMVNCEQHQE